jgi:hypothetical protein
VIDQFAIRLGKMKTRIFDWAMKVEKWREDNPSRLVMLTLTYRKVGDYKPGHIGNYLRNVKIRLGKNLLAFAWVAELQKRGAVHYHVMLLVKPGTDIPKPDKRGYWVHGMSKIETAKTPYYLATYTGKEFQKDLAKYPKSCRLYAVSIRASMGEIKAGWASGGLNRPIKERTAEGFPVWEFGATACGENGADYARMMTERGSGSILENL